MEQIEVELPATTIKQIREATNLNDAIRALMNHLGEERMPIAIMATVISKIRGSLYSETNDAVGLYIVRECRDDSLTFKSPKTPDEKMVWDMLKFLQCHQDFCIRVNTMKELAKFLVEQGWNKE
jgi:hypothetical protein